MPPFGFIVVAGGYIFSGEDLGATAEVFNVLPGGMVNVEAGFLYAMACGPVFYSAVDF